MPKASRQKYKCTQCSYSSKRPYDLKRHRSSLHGEGQSHRESKPERTTPIRACSVQSIVTPVPGNAEMKKGQQRALRKRGVTIHIVSSDSNSSKSVPDIFINQSSNSPTPIDKPKKEKTRIGPTPNGDSKKKKIVRLNINSNTSSESAGFGSERTINALTGVNYSSVYQLKKKKGRNAEGKVESDVKDAKKCNGSLINSSLNEEISEDAHPTVESVICTACCNQINPFKKNTFFGHPVLNVVFCKGCLDFYNSGPWKEDEDGIEEECRWCGQGGSLSVCDFCCMTFCRRCIMCNLGIVELDRTFSKKKWKCFVCEPSPLKELVAKCNALFSRSEEEMELKRHGTNSDDASVNVPDAQDKPEENADVESESEENLHKKAKKVRKSAKIDPTSRDQPLSFVSSSDEDSNAESDSCSGLKRESGNRKSKTGGSREVAENILMDEFEDNEGDGDKDDEDEEVDGAGSKLSKKKAQKKAEEDEEWDHSDSRQTGTGRARISTSSEDEEDEDTLKKKKGKKGKAAPKKEGKATKKRRSKKIDTDDDFAASELDDVSYKKPKRKRVTRSETASSSEESSVELKKPKKRRARRGEPGTSSETDSSKKRRGRGKGKKWRRINEASDSDSEED